MDIDLKIGAVFSLAADRDELAAGIENTNNRELLDFPDVLLPDNDNDEVDVMCDTSSTLSVSEDNMSFTDHICYTAGNDSMAKKPWNDSSSAVEDPDAPPSLLIEEADSLDMSSPPSSIPDNDYMSPPTLHPEEPVKTDTPSREQSQEKEDRCTTIDPCYIVLTSIDSVMKDKSYISSRSFKRSFTECSNMCKKIQFRRCLRAGKDVFSVKTPIKQKDYIIYLEQAEKVCKKSRKKSNRIKLTDILEKHDQKVEVRKQTSGKATLPRIRRTISRMPNDFANRPASPAVLQNGDANDMKEELSVEELARLNKQLIRKHHKVELDSLKKMIAIKRSLNSRLKRNKRVKIGGFETFFRSDVTSSVSGRVRKKNSRYSKEFAFSRKDFEEQRLVDAAHAQLKRTETESKRKVEHLKHKSELLKVGAKRKGAIYPENQVPDKSVSVKKTKFADVVIDNPEEGKEKRFVRMQHCFKAHIEEQKHGIRNTTTAKKFKKKNNGNRDGVLIQDMPNEGNVICNILQNDKANTAPLSVVKSEPCDQQNDKYIYVRELLKKSIQKGHLKATQKVSSTFQPKFSFTSNKAVTVPANNKKIEEEKYMEYMKNKTLRIPKTVKTVKQLLTEKEIKKEPVDEGSETSSMYSPVCPTIYRTSDEKLTNAVPTNSTHKKVLLTTPTPRNNSPTTLKPQASLKETLPVSILVNTPNGPRYLVPKSLISKDRLPSYSEAISAKVAKNGSESTTSTASVISTSSANMNIIGGSYSANQQLKAVRMPRIQHQGQTSGALSVIPSVVQVPLQTILNSSPTNTQINANVTGYKNTSLQKTPYVMNKSTNSSIIQTNTLVHRVLPVTQPHVSQSMSLFTKTNQTPKTSVVQSSATSVNNKFSPNQGVVFSGGQNQQKCLEKSKFYLLKIDGKNVLIPIEGDQAQPRAYVVNSDIITPSTQAQGKNISSTSLVSQVTTGSQTSLQQNKVGARIDLACTKPTGVVVPAAVDVNQQKPTLIVQPNMKQLNLTSLIQPNSMQNAVASSKGSGLVQTVTLTNIGLVARTTTVATSFTNAISRSDSIKTTCAATGIVYSGNTAGTSKCVGMPLLFQNNVSNNSVSKIPIYLSQYPGMQGASNSQLNVTSMNTKTPENVVNTQLFIPPVIEYRDAKDHTTQSDKAVNDHKANTYKTNKPTQQPIKIEKIDNCEADLCEKSGIFSRKKKHESVIKETEENPQAFKEAVTSREERLRRLKELLKEKQKAVEEIRSSKNKVV